MEHKNNIFFFDLCSNRYNNGLLFLLSFTTVAAIEEFEIEIIKRKSLNKKVNKRYFNYIRYLILHTFIYVLIRFYEHSNLA